jgi:diguanylate cyclase (GGDEF)-like protein/PAS domain S-box-containing protein
MHVLETEPDVVLDAFCEKVAKLFGVPTCVVSLVLEDKQWFKSSFGCPVELAQARETPRDISFCTHVVDSRQPLIVRDVAKDPRFANNPLVKRHGFGFYAGFPLITSRGHVLGSLCLYDHKAREFSEQELCMLGLFSERVMTNLELCRELEHIRASEARYRSIAGSAHDGLVVIGEEERIVDVNPAAERMFGWGRKELLGQPVQVLMPERYRQRHHESIGRFMEQGASNKFNQPRQFEAVRRDGTEFPVEISLSGFKADGKWTFTAFIRDITERKQTEEALQKREKQQRVVSEIGRLCLMTSNLEDAMNRAVEWTADTLGVDLCKILLLSDDGHSLLLAAGVGWRDGLVGQATVPTDLGSQAGYTLRVNGPVIVENLRTETRFNGPLLLHDHQVISGLSVPMVSRRRAIGVMGAHSKRPQNFTQDDVQFLQSVANLIAVAIERKLSEEALAEQAIRDTLTGLYNRRCFNQRVEEEIVRADRNQYTLAILLSDLDHFKKVNDTRGHQVGDEVLRVVAERICEATRGTDVVFRWGGDEFVVVLSDTTRQGVHIAAERIREGISKVSDQFHLTLGLSIGVALYPEHGRSVDELIRIADQALYIAKKGGGKVHIGEEEYRLDENSVQVVFQPVVAIQPIKNIRTGEAIGYEALSRDPEGKLSILDLFQKYKAIGKLNQLKCLCFKVQMKAAQELGLERVFINVDFNVLHTIDLIAKPPDLEVILEISELEAIHDHDIESRLQIAKNWRREGYKFAIDDFGAGFISLPFIARLMPEYIKVDRSTILQAVSSEPFKEFMIGLIFGLRNYSTEGIIAEGVETEKELKVVKEMGIFLVQGFLFSKPQMLSRNDRTEQFL